MKDFNNPDELCELCGEPLQPIATHYETCAATNTAPEEKEHGMNIWIPWAITAVCILAWIGYQFLPARGEIDPLIKFVGCCVSTPALCFVIAAGWALYFAFRR